MGITTEGRLAAITNFRDLKNHRDDAPTRGKLTLNFLVNDIHPEDYYEKLDPVLKDYNGFNLIFGSVDELYYVSNKVGGIKKLNQPALVEKLNQGDAITVIIDEIKPDERRITLSPGDSRDEGDWQRFTKDAKQSLGSLGEKLKQALESKNGKT